MIPHNFTYLLCSALLLLAPYVAASSFTGRHRDLTNAERIQRGLPLKAPKRHFDPTRPRRALQPRQSDASRRAIMVLEDGQKRAAYSGYLGFDQWGYLVVTTDASKAEVFIIPTLSTGGSLEIQSASNKDYLCVWKSGNPGLENWEGTLATEPSDGGAPLGKDPQTSIFGFYGYGTTVSALFQYDASTTLDLTWWEIADGYVIAAPRGSKPAAPGAKQWIVRWAEAP